MAEAAKFLNLPIFGRYNYLEQWMMKLRDNDVLTGLKVSLESTNMQCLDTHFQPKQNMSKTHLIYMKMTWKKTEIII